MWLSSLQFVPRVVPRRSMVERAIDPGACEALARPVGLNPSSRSDVWMTYSSLCLTLLTHDGLYRLAEAQAGYFTAQQALTTGMDRSTLRHHARPGGRYQRVRRGPYPVCDTSLPAHTSTSSRPCCPCTKPPAVVSHESALELYDLSDVIPSAVYISLPRTNRGQRPRPGVRFHTLQHPPALRRSGRSTACRSRPQSAQSWIRCRQEPSQSRSNSRYTRRSSAGSQHPGGCGPPPQSVLPACGASSNTRLLEGHA
jgi:hypothetical protein